MRIESLIFGLPGFQETTIKTAPAPEHVLVQCDQDCQGFILQSTAWSGLALSILMTELLGKAQNANLVNVLFNHLVFFSSCRFNFAKKMQPHLPQRPVHGRSCF